MFLLEAEQRIEVIAPGKVPDFFTLSGTIFHW